MSLGNDDAMIRHGILGYQMFEHTCRIPYRLSGQTGRLQKNANVDLLNTLREGSCRGCRVMVTCLWNILIALIGGRNKWQYVYHLYLALWIDVPKLLLECGLLQGNRCRRVMTPADQSHHLQETRFIALRIHGFVQFSSCHHSRPHFHKVVPFDSVIAYLCITSWVRSKTGNRLLWAK